MTRALVYLLILLLAAILFYQVGYREAAADVASLKAEVAETRQEREEYQAERQEWIEELDGVNRSYDVIYDLVFEQ
jgi:cell division protein FtsB